MHKTNTYLKNEKVILELPNSVSLNILDSLTDAIIPLWKKKEKKFNQIVLDLSKIKYIEPEGALAIVCFCAAIKYKNPDLNFHFIYPNDNVLTYLANLGFFSQMSTKVGIIEGQNIIHYESELKQKRRVRQKQFYTDDILRPIILPIETIPQQIDTISGRDFENMSITFVNNAINTFKQIFSSPHYNFSGSDQHDFLLSNRELYRNTFEHSTSWGIAVIHSRPNHGTQVCFYDIGIGFKGSVAKFQTDLQSIEWALIDGNSSKSSEDNDGHGLTVVQNFVLRRNGSITIRSGECMLKINQKTKTPHKVNRFPGVQLSYFIPV